MHKIANTIRDYTDQVHKCKWEQLNMDKIILVDFIHLPLSNHIHQIMVIFQHINKN